jgi:hypothetical protein
MLYQLIILKNERIICKKGKISSMSIFFIKMVILTISWSLGWRVIISKGMLFEKLGDWSEKKVEAGNKIYDVISCPFCIPNLHGILFVWPLAFGLGVMPFEWNYKYLLLYPFILSLSSFITGFTWNIYQTINSIKENKDWGSKYYENAQKNFYLINKKLKNENKISEQK